jgi:hypothetical protein
MEREYDVTYKFRKAVVHVVAPAAMTEKERLNRVCEFHHAAWEAWNSLPEQKRLEINAACKKG